MEVVWGEEGRGEVWSEERVEFGGKEEGCAGDEGDGVDLGERRFGAGWLGGRDVARDGAGCEVEFGGWGCG